MALAGQNFGPVLSLKAKAKAKVKDKALVLWLGLAEQSAGKKFAVAWQKGWRVKGRAALNKGAYTIVFWGGLEIP